MITLNLVQKLPNRTNKTKSTFPQFVGLFSIVFLKVCNAWMEFLICLKNQSSIMTMCCQKWLYFQFFVFNSIFTVHTKFWLMADIRIFFFVAILNCDWLWIFIFTCFNFKSQFGSEPKKSDYIEKINSIWNELKLIRLIFWKAF